MTDEGAPSRPLDAIDRTLIRLLTADGRMSVNELNPSKVGLEIAALIFVNADQHGWKALQHKLLDLPGLEHLAVTTGNFDFCLLVRVADMQTLRDVVLERLQAMPEVRSTQTAFVLDEHRPSPVTD